MTLNLYPVKSPVEIALAKGPQLDAFHRLRISSPTTLFDAQQEYGLDTLRVWDATANGTLSIATASSNGSVSDGLGNLVGPRDLNTRFTPITISATNGHYAILQSRKYPRYIPGKSHLILITGIFAAGIGYTASLILRTATSGSASDTNSISQTNWNVDKFDGTGPSGIIIDFTKTQVMMIDAQWLGSGAVTIGFSVDGKLFVAHRFLNANNLTLPYTQTFSLPVRFEHRNTGASESRARIGCFDSNNGIFLETVRTVTAGTINFICASVQSEGGLEIRGNPNSSSMGITTKAITTRAPVISIRPKALYNGVPNHASIDELEHIIRATTNDSLVEIVYNGILTGAIFTSASSNSAVEFDTAATAISGGEVILRNFALSGTGSNASVLNIKAGIRSSLSLSQIDALAATQIPISVVCTAFAGTSNISAIVNWFEGTA